MNILFLFLTQYNLRRNCPRSSEDRKGTQMGPQLVLDYPLFRENVLVIMQNYIFFVYIR